MKRELAINILNNIIEYSEKKDANYTIEMLKKSEYEDGFHHFIRTEKGYDILGVAKIYHEDTSYYFVFVDWPENNENSYIFIYPENKNSTLLELHKINEEYNSLNIEWRYKPNKRDGRNEDRKECFIKYYGDIISRVEVPKNVEEIETFLFEMFDLIDKRVKSDNIIFNKDIITEFPEGKVYERVHKVRERNSKLIQQIKKERLEKDKKLVCEICKFDFYKVYKDLGKGFIEAHHIIPVSQLKEDSKTKKEDIVLVCSNCHSMLHRKRPWTTIDEIKKLVNDSKLK